MKKKIVLALFFIIMIMATNVFATTKVSMEIVENNICTIDINEECTLEKKIIESDLENHKVTLQIQVSNNSKVVIPSGELMLVIDSSLSMNEKVEGETTRKDLVLNSANKLVEGLLEANPTTLKIGIVTFSSSSETNEEGYFVVGTEADAQKVCDLTNNLETLKNEISSIEGIGQYTNLDAGLKLAQKQFTADNTNKYMLILTDGVPNLADGNSELFSNEGIEKTKTTLASMEDVEIITMLTGVTDEAASPLGNTNTYGQIIENIFGTVEKPANGVFYKIKDSEIEQTITENIYRDLLPIAKTLENITIVDYIPQNIVDNFEITLTQDSQELEATISQDKKTITWNVEKLEPGESQTIKFDLVLKDKFNEEIIGEILNTNEKVDIAYEDFDGESKNNSSDVTPKIKLVADATVAPEIIPDAGLPIYGIIILALIGVAIFFGYKSKI